MATLASRPATRASGERRFFGVVALTIVACTFTGFARSYYFMRYTAAPSLPAIVHLHGIVFTLWILIYALQTGLIAMGRTEVHRRLGLATAMLAVVAVVLGFTVAILTASVVPVAGRISPPIIFPFVAITMFAMLTAAAIAFRRRPAHHKRLMMLGTVALATTPLARIGRLIAAPMPPPIFAMLATDVFLAALVAFDLRSRGRLHPATIAGGGIFLLSQPLRVGLAHFPPWQAFAASIGAH